MHVELLREPGGVALSERLRELVKDPALTVGARAEALLYAAARAQLVEERLRPLLEAGTWVLLDRFVDSSLAYQGGGRGLGDRGGRRAQPLRDRRARPRPHAAAARRPARSGRARAGRRAARRRPPRARGRGLLRRDRAGLRGPRRARARAHPRDRRRAGARGRARRRDRRAGGPAGVGRPGRGGYGFRDTHPPRGARARAISARTRRRAGAASARSARSRGTRPSRVTGASPPPRSRGASGAASAGPTRATRHSTSTISDEQEQRGEHDAGDRRPRRRRRRDSTRRAGAPPAVTTLPSTIATPPRRRRAACVVVGLDRSAVVAPGCAAARPGRPAARRRSAGAAPGRRRPSVAARTRRASSAAQTAPRERGEEREVNDGTATDHSAAVAAHTGSAPRPQMSSQRSQTSGGITPTRMSAAKIVQPRQNPKTDSSVAATTISPSTHVRRADRAEPERQHRGGHRQRRADALGEALRRPRDELLRHAQPRRDHAGDELAERAERRPGQHARDEAVGDHARSSTADRARSSRGTAATTMPATRRAETSLTGFGKEKRRCEHDVKSDRV